MQKFNFNKAVESLEGDKPASQTSNWWKRAEGDNRMRLLSAPATIVEHSKFDEGYSGGYTGICIGKEEGCTACAAGLKPKAKYLFWIIDRKDGQIKLAKLTYSVFKKIGKLQIDPDYTFEEMPMPYDINVKYEDAASPANKYDVVPARSNTPLTEAEKREYDNQHTVDSIVEKMKEKRMREVNGAASAPSTKVEYPSSADIDEIPF